MAHRARRHRQAWDPRRRTLRPRVEELEPRLVLSESIPLSRTSWADIGPAPIILQAAPFDIDIGLPASGRVTGLAVDPNTSNVYAATAGGGVWKWTLALNSWGPTMDNLSFNGAPMPLFMGAIALAPSNPQVIYAGTGEANNAIDSFYGVGILRSSDGGQSWMLTGFNGTQTNVFQGMAISQIAVDPQNPNIAWAAVSGNPVNGNPIPGARTGIYRTGNRGVTWTNMTFTQTPPLSGVDPWSAVVIDPTTSDANGGNAVLFAAVGNPGGSANNGIYRSTNGGFFWQKVDNLPGATPPLLATTGGRIALTISHPTKDNNATIYASVSSVGATRVGGNLSAFYVSTDGGTIWTDQKNRPGSTMPDFLTTPAGGQGGYDNVVAANPNDAKDVWAAGPGGSNSVIESTDGGIKWNPSAIQVVDKFGTRIGPHADHHALVFAPDFGSPGNTALFDGNDGGVWYLTYSTGKFWSSFNATGANHNLEITQFTGVALDRKNPNVVYGGSQDNGTEKFNDTALGAPAAKTWTTIARSDGGFVRVDPTTSGATQVVYHTFQSTLAPGMPPTPDVIERSDDGGQTWNNITGGIAGLANANFYTPYVIDPLNNQRLVLGTTQLFFTPDRGSPIPPPPPPPPGTAPGDWQALGNLPNLTNAPIDSIAIAPSDSNTIYVSAGPNLFVTTNAFTATPPAPTWTQINAPPVMLAPGARLGQFPGIAVAPNNPRTVYVVVGAFTQPVAGPAGPISVGEVWQGQIINTPTGLTANWTDITGNLPRNLPVQSITLFPPTSLVFVGTDVGVFATNQALGTTNAMTMTPGQISVANTQWVQYVGTTPDAKPMPNAQVVSLEGAVFSGDTQGILLAGTHGRGAWEIKIPDLITIQLLSPIVNAEERKSQFDLGLFSSSNLTLGAEGYTATVTWSDGKSETLTAANGGIALVNPLLPGIFALKDTHTFAEEGPATFQLMIASNDIFVPLAITSRASGSTIVKDAPLTVTLSASPVEGQLNTITVASFRDANPTPDSEGDLAGSDFTAIVKYGGPIVNGQEHKLTAANGGIVPSKSGERFVFDILDNPYYEEDGTFDYSVKVIDDFGTPMDSGKANDQQQGTVIVQDAPLKDFVVTPPANAVEGGTTGPVPVELATFSDTAGTFSAIEDFKAIVSWGDGSKDVELTPDMKLTPEGFIVRKNAINSYAVMVNHTFLEEGQGLKVTITDAGGAPPLFQSIPTFLIANAPLILKDSDLKLPAGAIEGAPTGLLTLATFSDTNPIKDIDPLKDYLAQVSWGDGQTNDSNDVMPKVFVAPNPTGGFDVLGSHTYAEEAVGLKFSVTVADIGTTPGVSPFSFDMKSALFNVADAPLTINPFTPPTGIVQGNATPLTLATWTDADPQGMTGDYKVTVNWGDGTPTSPGKVVDTGGGTFGVSAGHPYALPGTYTLSLSIMDGAAPSTVGGQVVVLQQTLTTLAANPNPSVFGQPVTFTATVTPAGGGQPTPTGTVTFQDGLTPLAIVPLGSVTTVSFDTLTLTSLMNWWKGEGNALDSAGLQNGTLVNGATFAPGRVGQAFNFNAATKSYAQFGPQSIGTADFSVAFWLRTTAAGLQTVLGNRVDAGGGNFFSIRMLNGKLVAELDQDAAGTNDVSLTSTGTVNDGAFHHVALVRLGSALALYLDGALDSSAFSAGVTNLTSTSPLVAGSEPAVGLVPAFTGLLDEIQVYARAITLQEIQATAKAGSAGLTSANAVLVISTIPPGMHNITASYSGDATSAPSFSAPTVLWPVFRASTTTALAVRPGTAEDPRAFTLTATTRVVAPGSGTPTGTVTFLDGTTVLGSVPLAGGVATLSTGPMAPRRHRFSAAYGGDRDFQPSLSGGGAPPDSMTAYVTTLYRVVLGGDPDAGGQAFWVHTLQTGLSRQQVAVGFWESAEHRGLQVDGFYATILHRPAEPTGRAAWVNAFLSGMREEVVERLLLISPEYQAAHRDTLAYIQGVYHDVLGRDADPTTGVGLGQVLDAIPSGRAVLADVVLNSREEHQRFVDGYYAKFLNRGPDQVGEQEWLQALQDPRETLDLVAEGFLDSDEFFARATSTGR